MGPVALFFRRKLKRFLYQCVPGFVGAYPYFGTVVRYPKGAWIILGACDHGVFERENTTLVSGMVRPGTWYYDVGANLGFLSIPVLKHNPDVKVASFEPSPTYLPYLTQTCAGSAYADRWQVVGQAVGATVGEVEFGVGSVKAWDDMIANSATSQKADQTVKVPMTTIDEFWKTSGRPEVSVIKIDIEGAELQGLIGASECLKACKPLLMVECDGPRLAAFGNTPKEVFAWAKEHGYTIARLPQVIPVRTVDEFQVHLLYAYNFLFLPQSGLAS